MLLVIVVHTSGYLGPISGVETQMTLGTLGIICDPIFFTLSGYFAFRPLKRTLKNYYLNKVSTILLPVILYSIILYFYTSRFENIGIAEYFAYFTHLMRVDWWFIPALVPCLMVAPFLYKGLKNLSDKQLVCLLIVVVAVFSSGEILSFARWGFNAIGFTAGANFCSLLLVLVPPGVLTGGPQYFQFFILGGIYRRLAPSFKGKLGVALIALGGACWILDTVFAVWGLPRTDPSYFWLFDALGTMILFERINIKGKFAQRVISWTGKRSYSIYLFQWTTIAMVGRRLYDFQMFGNVADMDVPLRILMWVLLVLGAYVLAWIFASILDTVLLKNVQNWFEKTFMKKSKTAPSEELDWT